MAKNNHSVRINIRVILVAFVVGVIIGVVLAPNVQLSASDGNATQAPNGQLEPRSAVAHIVAVSTDTNKGVIGTATVELIPGQGRVLISANPFVEPDTQESVAIARAVAENFTGVSLANNDVIASFELLLGNESAQVVGGPSAGAAITVALIAAVENRSVRSDVAITGRILPDGRIGSVGGILEKAQAAAEAGMQIFIVPAGQANITYYEKTESRTSTNGFAITRISYAPQTLSLNNYTKQWNMTSVEAQTIEEAAMFAIYNPTLPNP